MKIMVIDGNSILNRAFYGIKLLTNKEGLYTNAIYGFLSTYFKLEDEEKPDRVIVCFDVKAPTFRHEMTDTYKATRKGMPEELAIQLPLIKEVLDKMGIYCAEKAGFEADDLIGTISDLVTKKENECVIVTGDKDSLQLVSEKAKVKLVTTRMGTTSTVNYTPEIFFEKYGFPPINMIDLKALMGDSSDNIKGVAGVGEKTAMALVQKFNTIDRIYENIDDEIIKKGVRQKLLDGRADADLSYKLAKIICDVELLFDPNEISAPVMNKRLLFDLFTRFEFKNFISKLKLEEAKPEVALETEAYIQNSELKSLEEIQALFNVTRKEIPVFVESDFEIITCVIDNMTYIINLEEIGDKIEILKAVFLGNTSFVTYDAKSIIRKLLFLGIDIKSIEFDIDVAEYLLFPGDSIHTLEKLIYKYLGIEVTQEKMQMSLFEPKDNKPYTQRAFYIGKLYNIIREELIVKELLSVYEDIEHPLIYVLADMEVVGIKVDTQALQIFGKILETDIRALEKNIYKEASREFNINSPKQLGELLFDELKLPIIKKTKTGYSTNVEVLEKLKEEHEIIPYIMEYRTLSKLKSTYIDGLLKVVDEKDGRIHTSFKQTVTATGRLSSTEPNLQNIPVRTKLGSEIRKMFIADENYTLVDADYSQIELRVLAHIADDKEMIKAFSENQDIHAITASEVLKIPLSEVTSEMRSSAKAVNFGIVYGISDYALAQDIKVTRKEASIYIENYLSHYSGINKYMTDIKEFAKINGYVKSLYGRKRNLTDINAKNYNIRSGAERMALNTPIQATAADIIKIAMIKVHEKLKNLKSRLVLQVHDELIIEATLDEVEIVKNILCEEMQNVANFKVPLTANANVGKSWYETK